MFDHVTRTHLRTGRVAGVPIGLNLSWFLALALVLWTLGVGYFPAVAPAASPLARWTATVVCSLAFFASILLHELGHAVTARRRGIAVPGITLFVLGGVARIADEPATARDELRIAGAGPLVSFLLAALSSIALILGARGALVSPTLFYLALVNAALGLFNLLPALPLDGGRMLRAVLWWWTGDAVGATRWAGWTGRSCGGLLVALGLVSGVRGDPVAALWLVGIGVFIERTAAGSVAAAEIARGLREGDADLTSYSGASVKADRRQDLYAEWAAWRGRIDALPRPGEIADLEVALEPAETRRYVAARAHMTGLLDEAETFLGHGGDLAEVEDRLVRVSELYEPWRPGPRAPGSPATEAAEAAEAMGEEDPGDAILAGRPESFAPDPEEALTREPGSSVEF